MAYISFEPKDYFNIVLWNGNSSTQAITGVGFSPAWVWGKQRTGTEFHQLLDIIRGANNILISNGPNAAVADSNILNSFDADGFTVGNQNQLNDTGATYVGWNWKAGTSFTNDASATGIGSIDSTGSVSDTSGFSICSYTGTGSNGTVKHGLSTAPKMIIFKNRNTETNWDVFHGSLANTQRVHLDESAAANTSTGAFNSTSPTTAVFSVGNADNTNKSSSPMIAYCFSEIKGYSKISKYKGNGAASDNTFIYCGFKPKFILHKAIIAENWLLWDSPRNTAVNSNGNPTQVIFEPNGAGAENNTTARAIDLLSNGFKIRGNNANFGGSGTEYIFMALAENPFTTSTGIPTTAG